MKKMGDVLSIECEPRKSVGVRANNDPIMYIDIAQLTLNKSISTALYCTIIH